MQNLINRISVSLVVIGCFTFNVMANESLPFYSEAQRQEANSFDLADYISGSTIDLRWQIDEKANGRVSNRVAIRPRLNLTIPLTQRMRIILQAQTGGGYSSGFDRLISLDGREAKPLDTFALRRLFLEYDVSESVTVQAGGLQARPNGVRGRRFSQGSNAWIDGLRLSLRDIYKNIDQIHVTIGQLDPNASRNVFNRNFDPSKADFIQITVAGDINERISYLVEADHLGIADETFARMNLDLSINDWTKNIIDTLQNELLIDVETGRVAGLSTGLVKVIGPVTVNTGLIRNERQGTQILVNEGFFRERGDSAYMILQYKFGQSNEWRLSQRCRACVNSDCTGKYRCDTTLRHKF